MRTIALEQHQVVREHHRPLNRAAVSRIARDGNRLCGNAI